MHFSFPTLLSCLFRLFFVVKAFLYQIPALYLVIRPVLKVSQLQWSVLGPLLPVQKGLHQKRQESLTWEKEMLFYNECGRLHLCGCAPCIVFTVSVPSIYLSDSTSTAGKTSDVRPMKSYQNSYHELDNQIKICGLTWTPKLILKLRQTSLSYCSWHLLSRRVHTLSYCFLALFLSEDAIKIQKVNMLRSHQFNNISSCWKQK